MLTSPSAEDLEAFNERLAAAYATLDEAKTCVEAGLDAVEETRDEARRIFGTPEATSAFGNVLSDIHLAARTIASAIAGLPALDEGDANEEEDSKSA
jgi:hypothetical protein